MQDCDTPYNSKEVVVVVVVVDLFAVILSADTFMLKTDMILAANRDTLSFMLSGVILWFLQLQQVVERLCYDICKSGFTRISIYNP